MEMGAALLKRRLALKKQRVSEVRENKLEEGASFEV